MSEMFRGPVTLPTIGRVVIFTTGEALEVPALVISTSETDTDLVAFPRGTVHLAVFDPNGTPGHYVRAVQYGNPNRLSPAKRGGTWRWPEIRREPEPEPEPEPVVKLRDTVELLIELRDDATKALKLARDAFDVFASKRR